MASGDYWQSEADQNRKKVLDTGDNLNNALNNQFNYYQNLQDGYRGQADQAYSDLAQHPGFSAEDAAGIKGNPNSPFQYYNPDAITGTAESGANDINHQVSNLQDSLGQNVTDLKSGLKSNVGDYQSQLGSAVGGMKSGIDTGVSKLQGGLGSVADSGAAAISQAPSDQLNYQGGVYNFEKNAGDQAVSGLDKGMDGAVGQYGSSLNSAIDPSKLSLDSDFASEYKMTPAEQQNIKDVAAQTTQGQFQSMRDEAEMRAAAGGNTSPAAMAAIEQNLGRSGAIAAGNAASQAELNANKAAADRELTYEQERLGANSNLANMQEGAASNLYGAQSGAAQTEYGARSQQDQNLAGNELSGINSATGNQLSAAEQAAGLRYGAASTGGQAAINAAETEGNAALGATNAGNQAAIGATEYGGNAAIGANATGYQAGIGAGEYNTSTGLGAKQQTQATGQTLASNADNNASSRATTVANQNIAGQNNYRGYLTGEQGAAQSGNANAASTAVSNEGTEYGAANQATNIGSGNQTTNRGQTTGLISGIVGDAAHMFATGGVITKPTVGIVGERGPEMVVPLGNQSKVRRYRAPMAA